jgi:hypothetical protein
LSRVGIAFSLGYGWRNPVETRSARPRNGLAVFIIIAIALLLFSIVSGFSIGLIIMPIPLVMFGSVVWWNRSWVVAGLVAAVVAGSMVFLLTAPLTEFHYASVQGGVRTQGGGCGRTILPDVPLDECDDATGQAFMLAIAAAVVVGLGTGFGVRAAARSGSSV